MKLNALVDALKASGSLNAEQAESFRLKFNSPAEKEREGWIWHLDEVPDAANHLA